MKNLHKLLVLCGILLFSCEIEKLNTTESQNENVVESESIAYTKGDVVKECVVVLADRCTTDIPDYNFWWYDPAVPFNDQFFASSGDQALQYIEYNDGSVNIKGLTFAVSRDCEVELDLWLKDKKNWEEWSSEGGEFKEEGCSGALAPDLSYYVIDGERSVMTSSGNECSSEGSYKLVQRPDLLDPNEPKFGVVVGPGGALWDTNIGALGLATWASIVDADTGEHLWSVDFNFRIECPEVCEPCDGKVSDLTLKYNGTMADAHIVVVQKKDNIVVFDGTVQPNELFSFSGEDKKGTLGTEIKIYVNDELATKIHTSCSKPIGPGLVSGDFEVVEGESRNGGNLCPVDPEPPGDDCDDCEGKATYLLLQYDGHNGADISVTDKKGHTEIFSGFVEAGGSFELQGFDKKETLGTEIVLFVNGHENTNIHTSCSKPIGPGLVRGDFQILAGTSRNGGAMCPVDPSSGDGHDDDDENDDDDDENDDDDDDDDEDDDDDDENDDDKDCGECDGKAINMELKYNGATSAQISVVQKKDGKVVFNAVTEPGSSFFFEGSADNKGTLGTEVVVYIDNVENTRIHTSCSKPIGIGLISGDFEVVGGASRNGGAFCEL